MSVDLTSELEADLARLRAENEALRTERDEARGWAAEWRRIAETICTVLGFDLLDSNTIVGAVRSKFDASESALAAAEAKAARLETALRELVDQPCAYHGSVIHIPADSHGDAMMRVTRARAALEAKP